MYLPVCYPTVRVDIIGGCVRRAEWNPNEGVALSERKATPAPDSQMQFNQTPADTHTHVFLQITHNESFITQLQIQVRRLMVWRRVGSALDYMCTASFITIYSLGLYTDDETISPC